jgi:hypothetical protein
MKIRSKSSRKSGTTITLTAEGGKDSETLLKLIHEMAKPTPPAPPKKAPAALETPPSTETPE